MPSALNCLKAWNTCSTMSGARPRLGSSNSSKRGRPIRARPIASICCCPPERDPASWLARSASNGKSYLDPREVPG